MLMKNLNYIDNFNTHERILKELKKYSRYYAAFIGMKSEYSDEILVLLKSFNILEQTTIYTFLLRIFEKHDDGNIQDDDLINILKFLRNYSIRRIIFESPSNELNKIYKGLYKKQEASNKYYSELVKNLLKKDKNNIFDDEEFKNRLIYKNLYKNKNLCKYILSEIENQSKEKIDCLNLTVEHILPQKENILSWKKEIGEDYEKVYQTYLHTLGNLTITGYNCELGTKNFSEKKEIIKNIQTNKILNEDIINANKWNEAAILNRAKRLSKIILEIFNYKKVETNLNPIGSDEFISLEPDLDLRYTKPYKFIFCGEETSVNNKYVEMLEKFINLLYEIQPELFDILAKNEYKIPNAREVYIGYDSSKIRNAKKINKIDIFYETNLSANCIINFIMDLMKKSELEVEDFKFAIKKK